MALNELQWAILTDVLSKEERDRWCSSQGRKHRFHLDQEEMPDRCLDCGMRMYDMASPEGRVLVAALLEGIL